MFKGKYLNGKRNGKGKEYYLNGNIYFEGEYLNGVENGEGKEYSNHGRLLFEGEYYNGQKWKEKGQDYIIDIVYLKEYNPMHSELKWN